jgi:hypothetical protein
VDPEWASSFTRLLLLGLPGVAANDGRQMPKPA